MAQSSRLLAAVAAATLATPAALAHHSAAAFDMTQSVTVEGVVTRYEWANPHVYIYVEQATEDGSTIEWELEGQPPSMMRRMGWSPDRLSVGDLVAVTGSPSRSAGGHELLLMKMTRSQTPLFDMMADFRRLAVVEPSEATAESLDGVWTTRLAFMAVGRFAQPAQSFELTEAGRQAIEAFDEATMNPSADCVPLPPPLHLLTPDLKRVAIEDGVVRLGAEFDGSERTVHMDAASHDGAAPSVLGHSIGRWEGATLVIETGGFAPHRMGNGAGLPGGLQKRLVERLTLAEDGKSLTYAFELTDPEYLAAPVTGELIWDYTPDLEFAPLACDLENARRFRAE